MNSSDQPVILHQWRVSPFCGKVRKLLHFKGIAHETHENYNGLRSFLASRLSRQGTLPVLDIDGRRLVDSNLIARHLDERAAGPRLFPESAALAARARLWNQWADDSLFWMEVYLRVCDRRVSGRVGELLSAGRPRWEARLLGWMFRIVYLRRCRHQGLARLPHARILQRFEEQLDLIDQALTDGPWLLGAEASIADFAVSAQLDEILRTSAEAHRITRRPTLMRWLERCALPGQDQVALRPARAPCQSPA